MVRIPKVSVLITLYNKGPFVEEAIRSILNNSFTDIEVIVVDDASTDNGVEVVKSISDERVRLIECDTNGGRAKAANTGFDAARGAYVAVLDADDIAHSERLRLQVEYLDAHPEVGALGSEYRILGEESFERVREPNDADCRAKLLFGDAVIYGTVMLRRSVLEEHGLRCNEQWRTPGMDYLFTLKVGLHTKYANIPEPLIDYRMGANNMRHGRDFIQDKELIVEEAFRLIGIPIDKSKLKIQMALYGLFRDPYTPDQVRALWSWKNELVALVKANGLIPFELFEKEVQRRWAKLFFRFADMSVPAAIAHLRCSGAFPSERISYLAKVALARLVGRM